MQIELQSVGKLNPKGAKYDKIHRQNLDDNHTVADTRPTPHRQNKIFPTRFSLRMHSATIVLTTFNQYQTMHNTTELEKITPNAVKMLHK